MNVFAVKFDNGWTYEDYASIIVVVCAKDEEEAIETAKQASELADYRMFNSTTKIPTAKAHLSKSTILNCIY
jgi:hypothetical protein